MVAALGIGLTSVFKMLGTRFGPESGERLKSKINFINFTRAAYDDMRARSDTAAENVEAVNLFLGAVGQAMAHHDEVAKRASALARKPTGTEAKAEGEEIEQLMREDIMQTEVLIGRFDGLLELIPKYLGLLDILFVRYDKHGAAIQEPVKSGLAEARRLAKVMSDRYEHAVRGALSVSPEVRLRLRGLAPEK